MSHTSTTSTSVWRLPVMLMAVLAALVGVRWFHVANSGSHAGGESAQANRIDHSPGSLATGESVSLTIDFGNGVQRQFQSVVWRDSMTISDLMHSAATNLQGIEFAQLGSADSAFLTQIDGVGNEGASGKNWQYWVNEVRGDRSFGIYKLRPDDHVLWKFASQQ